jgi:hypothetical protein
MFRDGFTPRALRTSHGSWLRFVRAMGDLSPSQSAALDQAPEFLAEIESTRLTKSFKILTLLALLDAGQVPGFLPMEALEDGFRRQAERSARLREDVGPALASRASLARMLETNPINAWTRGGDSSRKAFFTYQDRRLATRLNIATDLRESFQDLVRELAEWRLAEYLHREEPTTTQGGRFICKVSHAHGHAILLLPDRAENPSIPMGWVHVDAEGRRPRIHFVKEAIHEAHDVEGDTNVLPEVLTTWFGPDADRPGTNLEVAFDPMESGYTMRPL